MSKLVVEAIENAAGSNPLSVLMTENTTTGGTEIDFTGIPSGVTKITLLWNEVSSSGTSDWIIQIGDSGGVETTGYRSSTQEGTANTQSTVGFIVQNSTASGLYTGSYTFYLEDSAAFTWNGRGSFARTDGGSGGHMAGRKSLSAELDRIRLTTVGGSDTFDANEGINVRYEY